jgi:hypothetical protein
MPDGPEWFAPKRFGYGAGLPIAWQGWLLTIAYMAGITLLAIFVAPSKPIVFFAILVPATVAFVTIAAKTTRGGWRWRSGEAD